MGRPHCRIALRRQAGGKTQQAKNNQACCTEPGAVEATFEQPHRQGPARNVDHRFPCIAELGRRAYRDLLCGPEGERYDPHSMRSSSPAGGPVRSRSRVRLSRKGRPEGVGDDETVRFENGRDLRADSGRGGESSKPRGCGSSFERCYGRRGGRVRPTGCRFRIRVRPGAPAPSRQPVAAPRFGRRMKVKSTLDSPPPICGELPLGAGRRRAKAQDLGLCPAALLGRLTAHEMRAPVSRRRPFSSPGSPASRGRCAGRRPRPARRARARRRASACRSTKVPVRMPLRLFAPARISSRRSFLRGQRGLAVGVVLLAGEQAPKQAGELARRGDDRDLVAAPALDPPIEGADRARLAHRRPARLDERVAGGARALLRDPPVGRGARARLAHPAGRARGSRPACAGSRSGAISPIAAMNVAAQITLTPGTVISRLISAAFEGVGSDQPLDRLDLGVEELDLAQRRVDRLALLSRELELGEPVPALLAEQVAERRRGRSAGASGPRGSRSLPGVRAPTSWLRRCRRRRITWVLRSGIQTASSSPAASSFARVRASRRSVFARAERIPVSVGETTITSPTWGSIRRLISQALPVTSSATRSSAPRLCGEQLELCSGLVSIRPAERTSPSSAIATSQNSRWTSNPIALTCSSSRRMTGRSGVGKRHRRIRARSATGQVAGAANEKPGLGAHRPEPACPSCVLPEAPVPVSRP